MPSAAGAAETVIGSSKVAGPAAPPPDTERGSRELPAADDPTVTGTSTCVVVMPAGTAADLSQEIVCCPAPEGEQVQSVPIADAEVVMPSGRGPTVRVVVPELATLPTLVR